MGSVQRMATIVVVGLVTLSTILFLYLGDENNRIETEAAEQQEVAIERGRENFISLCLSCHGPAGEGYTEPGVAGTGRIGAALGGINTSLNQQGINSQGTPVAGGVAGREDIIRNTITNGLKNPDGTFRMPPFGAANGGPLNDEQIDQLVLLIQHGDWNETYNAAIEASGGYPTPPPAPGADATATAEAEGGTEPTAAPSTGGGEATEAITITMHDIYFDPAEVTIPANTPVKVSLPNDGAALHDFSIDALGIAVQVNPGDTGEVTIDAPAGEYEYYCSIPGHKAAGMVGKLIVKEGAGGAAAAPASDSTESAPAAPAEASGGEAAAAQDVTVTMHDVYFDPTEITIPANTPVKFTLPNDGAALHDFSIDALDVSVTVNPGDTGEVTIDAPAGEYEFYCNIPGHKEAGMVGKLIVTEGGGGGEAAAAPAAEATTPETEAAPGDTADAAGDSAAAQDVTVTMHDVYFDPTDFTIPANTPVKVTLPNEGAALHDFSIDELGISVTVNPGDTGEVTIDAPAGVYDFYCNIPGHKEAGMVGTLTVQ